MDEIEYWRKQGNKGLNINELSYYKKMQYKKTETAKKYIRDGRAPIPISESTSRVMSANKGKNTKPELILRKALFLKGIRGYRLHWKKIPGHPDIAFTKKKIAIFVNGCFWHRCPFCKPSIPKSNYEFWENKFQKNKDRDENKKALLEKMGWEVLIFWECQIKGDVNNCVNSIYIRTKN